MPSTTSLPRRRSRRGRALLGIGVTLVALALAGCSGGDAGTNPQAPSSGAGQNGPGGRNGGQRQPGVSGLIAARSGSTLQVQGTTEQTAVSWTDQTRFTEVRGATAAALKVGLCAAVRPADGSSASTGTTVAAGSVTLSAAVDGTCTGGFGGARPSGAPSDLPSGAPGGVPSGGPDGAPPSGMPSGAPGPGAGRGTDGKVTSVTGSTFVVAATTPGAATTTDVTVTTSSTTTFSEQARTSDAAAKVGRCAFAMGSTSSTGALTATTIRISTPASDGTCGGGFGGRGAPQPGGGSTTNG